MKKFITLSVLLTFILTLVGCSHTMSENITKPATDKKIKKIPDWYLNPPNEDNVIYAPGTATSRDMQMSKDKASLTARNEIANTLESHFTGLAKRFQEEVGTELEAQYLDQFTNVTKNVTDATLVGVVIDETDIRNEDGIFRCYILLKLDMNYTNKLLADKIKADEQLYTRLRASEAFKELDASQGP